MWIYTVSQRITSEKYIVRAHHKTEEGAKNKLQELGEDTHFIDEVWLELD